MKFDVFFSICQNPVDGHTPSEPEMFHNFFSQVECADRLGYGVAWVAETHLSCQVQKRNPGAVIPHFEGEIGLNTDITQLAARIFARTEAIEVGAAIRNILCNGGPLAHAEALRSFAVLHGLDPREQRRLHCGIAAGRFPFSNEPYGIVPRNAFEKLCWSGVKRHIFLEAAETLVRALEQPELCSEDIAAPALTREDCGDSDWDEVVATYRQCYPDRPVGERLTIERRWRFPHVGLVPRHYRRELLNLVVGSQDPAAQALVQSLRPSWVFNLSITPAPVIEKTHQQMAALRPDWQRDFMPRTVLVFLEDGAGADERAKARAQAAVSQYWLAMAGTLPAQKVAQAVDNALAGSPETVAEQICERFDPEDRLMLWFDFNCHDNAKVQEGMTLFQERVVPALQHRAAGGMWTTGENRWSAIDAAG